VRAMTCAFLRHRGTAGNAALICFAVNFGMEGLLARRQRKVTAKEGRGGVLHTRAHLLGLLLKSKMRRFVGGTSYVH